MVQGVKAKLVVWVIGSMALLGIIGGGGLAFAQTHGSVTARSQSGVAANQSRSITSPLVSMSGQQPGEDWHIQGVVQSVHTAAFVFALVPDGKMQALTIAFDQKTMLEQEHGQLATGVHVLVEVVQRSDGTLYATEIKPGTQMNQGKQNANDGNDDNDTNDDRGHDQGGHGGDRGEGNDG